MKHYPAIIMFGAAAMSLARAATLTPLSPLPALSPGSATTAAGATTSTAPSLSARGATLSTQNTAAAATPPRNPLLDMPREVVDGIGAPMMAAMNDPGIKAAHQKTVDNVAEFNNALHALINKDLATKGLVDRNPVLFGYLEVRVNSALKAPPGLLNGQSSENIQTMDALAKVAQSDATVQAALKKGPELMQQFKDTLRAYLAKDPKIKALIEKYPDDYNRLVEILATAPFAPPRPSPRGAIAPTTTAAPHSSATSLPSLSVGG